MAVTLDTDLQQATSAYKDVSLEDFMDAIDAVQPAKCPMLAMTENEIALGSTYWFKNVDSYDAPKGARGVADGEDVAAADITNHAANIRKVGNVAQGFRESFGAGWIAANVPKIAGVGNLAAHARTKATIQLKRQWEVAFCSLDQTALLDAGNYLGAIGAGYLKLTASANKYAAASAVTFGKASDIHFAPAGAVLTGVLSATHSRSMWGDIAFALRVVAQEDGDWTALLGLTLRRAVTDLTNPVMSTAYGTAASAVGGATQVRVLLREEQDNVLGATVDVIQTDFGRILVKGTDYVGYTTVTSTGAALTAWATSSAERVTASFSANARGGLIVKRGNVFKRTAIPPFSRELAYNGGRDAFDMKALIGFGIRNPSLAGHINFTA